MVIGIDFHQRNRFFKQLHFDNNGLYNPHLPSGLVHPYQLDEFISNFRGV